MQTVAKVAGNDSGRVPAPETGEAKEEFITKPTVAQRMKKCARTIDNLMAKGLPHYKVGRSVIFRWSEVEAHLAANYRVCHRNLPK